MATAELGRTPFAVVDLETTGVYSGGHDRIVEIAIVRMSPSGDVEDEFASLVNPQRDMGPENIHGISAAEAKQAPRWGELAGDIECCLRGAILIGHFLRFDKAFLAAEFRRLDVQMPPLPASCTLEMAYRYTAWAPSRKLACCCEEMGIPHESQHTALGDARACAMLLLAYLEKARAAGHGWEESLRCETLDLPEPGWSGAAATGRAVPRQVAARGAAYDRAYLGRLVEQMPGDEGKSPREAEYLGLLDRILEDRVITLDEAEGLVSAAADWGMQRDNVHNAHRAYLWSLVAEAQSDGVVTATEKGDLELVADLLGLHRSALDAMLVEVPARPAIAPPVRSNLVGQTVCFTGELSAQMNGQRITRDRAEQLARESGLLVLPSVTKRLDILVTADPDSASGKARKARLYGTRIMAEAPFWQQIGVLAE